MVKIFYTNNKGTVYQIPCGKVIWQTNLKGAPSKLTFTVPVKNLKVDLKSGAFIRAYWKDKLFFVGFIFSRDDDNNESYDFVAYDQIRYLQYEDTMVFKKATATQIIKNICKIKNLNCGKIADTKHKGKFIYDEKSYLDMIYDALDKTLEATGKLYCMYDDVGSITLKELKNMSLPLIIGNKSLLNKYSASTSIDGETYNYISVINEIETGKGKKKKKKRKVYTRKDITNIKKWGVLNKMFTVKNYTEALAKQYANNLLKNYNREEKKLSVDCVGDLTCRAGFNVVINYRPIADKPQRFIIESAEHEFMDNNHTMGLELRVDD